MMHHAAIPNRAFCHLHRASLLLAGLLLLALACVPRTAWAVCWFTSGSVTSVTYNVGTTITLTPDTPVNTVLWTSSVAAPANPSDLSCNGSTQSGIHNIIAGPPDSGDDTLFPTGIQGISYRLLHPDASSKLAVYPHISFSGGSGTIGTALQLVYTGPLPPDNSILTGQLSQWEVDICDNPSLWGGYYYLGCNGSVTAKPVEIFNINAIIHILVPTCDIDPGSVNKLVTLPPVLASQFTGMNSTTGDKPFTLNLTDCPNNLKVSITLDTDYPWTGNNAKGVIAPTPGANQAQDVGVQLLQADGTTAVSFGDAFPTGTTSGNGSNYTINLHARYYQTGTSVTGGEVNTIARYTITYQ